MNSKEYLDSKLERYRALGNVHDTYFWWIKKWEDITTGKTKMLVWRPMQQEFAPSEFLARFRQDMFDNIIPDHQKNRRKFITQNPSMFATMLARALKGGILSGWRQNI